MYALRMFDAGIAQPSLTRLHDNIRSTAIRGSGRPASLCSAATGTNGRLESTLAPVCGPLPAESWPDVVWEACRSQEDPPSEADCRGRARLCQPLEAAGVFSAPVEACCPHHQLVAAWRLSEECSMLNWLAGEL